MRISQRGDSGTQARISKVTPAGSRPIANRPRQPRIGVTNAPNAAPMIPEIGNSEVTSPPTKPRLEEGTNSWTNGRSTVKRPATPKPTKKRQTLRKIQPPRSGVSAITPVASEKFSAVMMKTVRRPIRSASQP